MLWYFSVLLSCSTYRYAVTYAANPATVESPAAVVAVGFKPDPAGAGLGTLVVTNQGPERVYLVWNELTTIQGGIQAKAYKGDVVSMMKDVSIPDQPIAAGASVTQSLVTERTYVDEA